MLKIYIIGLGTGQTVDLSQKSCDLIKGDLAKYARTISHPVFHNEEFSNLISFDDIFENNLSIENVYDEIYTKLNKELTQRKEIIYLVPGSPYYGDFVTERFIEEADENIKVEIIDAESFLDKAIKLGKVKKQKIKIIEGNICQKYDFDIDSCNIITNIENRSLASKVKIELTEIYPDDYKIVIIDVLANKTDHISLFELDRQKKYGYSTYIFVESIENSILGLYNINDLKKTMAYLRGPEGCPWDRKQNHMSLRECVIEEAYEVVEAIENDDMNNLVEELGDLLLQVVFHAQLASEEGYFTFEDITSRICRKLYSRHPHVFNDADADNESEATLNWEQIKKKEKNINSHSEKISSIPKALSPLTRGYKIQKTAAEVGFDWPDISGPINKVREEIKELMEAYELMEKDKIEEELGDLLFAIVNFSRFLKINPDIALNRTNEKFIKRFKFIEENSHKDLKDMTLEEMDALWETSKRH
jgi:tetrapyrrole methylase family protein/MazG family protein